ncbi:unnamed protein product, partial [Polarella glacialis]
DALVQYYAAAVQQQVAAVPGLSAAASQTAGPGTPSTGWLTNRLVEREKARIEKNFAEADRLRQLLRQNGVEVDDRERTWSCRDGRKGARPNHNDPPEPE